MQCHCHWATFHFHLFQAIDDYSVRFCLFEIHFDVASYAVFSSHMCIRASKMRNMLLLTVKNVIWKLCRINYSFAIALIAWFHRTRTLHTVNIKHTHIFQIVHMMDILWMLTLYQNRYKFVWKTAISSERFRFESIAQFIQRPTVFYIKIVFKFTEVRANFQWCKIFRFNESDDVRYVRF